MPGEGGRGVESTVYVRLMKRGLGPVGHRRRHRVRFLPFMGECVRQLTRILRANIVLVWDKVNVICDQVMSKFGRLCFFLQFCLWECYFYDFNQFD